MILRPRPSSLALARALLRLAFGSLVLLAASGCGSGEEPATGTTPEVAPPGTGAEAPADRVRIPVTERPAEVVLDLRERLAAFERAEAARAELNAGPIQLFGAALMAQVMPSEALRATFEDEVRVRDLRVQQATQTKEALPLYRAGTSSWWVEEEDRVQPRDEVSMLASYLRSVKYVEAGSVHLLEGAFADDEETLWVGTGVLHYLGKELTGRSFQIEAPLQMTWHKTPDGWRMRRIALVEWNAIEGERKAFQEALDLFVSDPAQLDRLTHSDRDELLEQGAVADGSLRDPLALAARPAVAVSDVDGDGWDDALLVSPHGPTRFLHNGGTEGLQEQAADLGLDVPGGATAIFGDFDNDGDRDVFIGRALERSVYLANEDGRFVDRSETAFAEPLPYFAVTASAVDFDRDGLLDLFVGTQVGPWLAAAPRSAADLAPWFEPAVAARLAAELEGQHAVLDRAGPPDLLFRNAGGGRFERASAAAAGPLGSYRETSQVTFTDYDDDGDADAYVANAWGPDVLARNDGGQFVDVTAAAGIADIGPSNGVSWGDTDGDGDLDAWVSKTWSTSFRGLVARFPELSAPYRDLFRGSSLYRNEGNGTFLRVSASGGLGVHADLCDEASAGLVVDTDNDADNDLVSLAGGYTPPLNLVAGPDLEGAFWAGAARADLDAAAGRAFAGLGSDTPGRPLFGSRHPHFLMNSKQRFRDLSYLGRFALDADGSGMAAFDPDRDGWHDLLVTNASAPRIQLYESRMGRSLSRVKDKPRAITVRLVGGNRSASPTDEWSNRDGIGALIVLGLGQEQVVREVRAGEGRASQSAATQLVGIGDRRFARSLDVHWPSGKSQQALNVAQGSLVTVYENPADAPDGQAFQVERYVVRSGRAAVVHAAIGVQFTTELEEWAPINLLIAIDTHSEAVRTRVRHILQLVKTFAQKEVRVYAVSTDLAEGKAELDAWIAAYGVPYPVLTELPIEQRAELKGHLLTVYGRDTVPGTVALDQEGKVLRTYRDVPSVYDMRTLLERVPEKGE